MQDKPTDRSPIRPLVCPDCPERCDSLRRIQTKGILCPALKVFSALHCLSGWGAALSGSREASPCVGAQSQAEQNWSACGEPSNVGRITLEPRVTPRGPKRPTKPFINSSAPALCLTIRKILVLVDRAIFLATGPSRVAVSPQP
jgi:hypothetical protein